MNMQHGRLAVIDRREAAVEGIGERKLNLRRTHMIEAASLENVHQHGDCALRIVFEGGQPCQRWCTKWISLDRATMCL